MAIGRDRRRIAIILSQTLGLQRLSMMGVEGMVRRTALLIALMCLQAPLGLCRRNIVDADFESWAPELADLGGGGSDGILDGVGRKPLALDVNLVGQSSPPPPPYKKPPAKKKPPPPPPDSGRTEPKGRSAMCQSRSLLSKGIVGGKRYGSDNKYFHACLNPATNSRDCCTKCQQASGCEGWFFTRLDCTAFSGSSQAGVCYMMADAILAYQDKTSWWSGGTAWGADQTGWNMALDWGGAGRSAVAMGAGGQQVDEFDGY